MTTNFNIHELFPKSTTINTPRSIEVYHGSNKRFDDFDFKKLSKNTSLDFLSMLGFHFTTDEKIAQLFIGGIISGGQMMVCKLNMKKTLKLTEHELVLGIVKYLIQKGIDFDYDELVKLPYFDNENWSLYKYLIHYNDYYYAKKMVRNFMRSVLLKNGYDSIEYLNQIEGRKDKKIRYDYISLVPNIIEIIDIEPY